MTHKHIGPEDWSVTARMLKAAFTGSEIARTLGKDQSEGLIDTLNKFEKNKES